jgi:hypothetical protein
MTIGLRGKGYGVVIVIVVTELFAVLKAWYAGTSSATNYMTILIQILLIWCTAAVARFPPRAIPTVTLSAALPLLCLCAFIGGAAERHCALESTVARQA